MIPTYEDDLFAPDALAAPFAHYHAIRELGPVVRLRDPDVYAIPRYEGVRDALLASDVLASGDGIGFNDVINANRGPNLIASDGDQHQRMKRAVLGPLRASQVGRYRERLKAMIAERIAGLVNQGPFDAMARIARYLPTAAISEFVGLPEEGRASMLDWANATFNGMGPMREGIDGDFAQMREARAYMDGLDRTRVREGSWAANLFDAAASGRITDAEARGALSAYVMPSLDTTIYAKGHLLRNLALAPEEWARLRRDPALIPGAVLEGVRHSSVIRWFARVARADYAVDDSVIPQGARVMVMYAAANRDERQYPDPDRFDVTRDARAHLAWGNGPHMCAGMHLARLEMEVMLEALVETCDTLECGEPEPVMNRTLFGFRDMTFELRGNARKRQPVEGAAGLAIP